MVRISDSGTDWKEGFTPLVDQPFHKTNSSSSSSSSSLDYTILKGLLLHLTRKSSTKVGPFFIYPFKVNFYLLVHSTI